MTSIKPRTNLLYFIWIIFFQLNVFYTQEVRTSRTFCFWLLPNPLQAVSPPGGQDWRMRPQSINEHTSQNTLLYCEYFWLLLGCFIISWMLDVWFPWATSHNHQTETKIDIIPVTLGQLERPLTHQDDKNLILLAKSKRISTARALYGLDISTLTAVSYLGEILGPIVRPCAGVILMWREHARFQISWRMNELIPLNVGHPHLT